MATQVKVLVALVVMASGRAMTLAFIARAGDGGPGDPPAAWLMPLVGDAFIGVTALLVAFLIVRRPSAWVWVIAVVWSALGAFDAFAAFLVEVRTPWPEFFMIEAFGRSMFFAAVALHAVIIYLLTQPTVREHFGVSVSVVEQPSGV